MPQWAHVPGETREADHARLANVKVLVPVTCRVVLPVAEFGSAIVGMAPATFSTLH